MELFLYMKHPDTPTSLPLQALAGQGKAYLFTVFAHVREDLRECAHRVEFVHVHSRLLGQVCVHVLVTDRWHLPNV